MKRMKQANLWSGKVLPCRAEKRAISKVEGGSISIPRGNSCNGPIPYWILEMK